MEEKTTTAKDGAKSIDEVYAEIDARVHGFIKEFIEFLPTTADVSVNMNIVVDKLLSAKESAKLLVNNYAQNLALKEQSTDGDKKDG